VFVVSPASLDLAVYRLWLGLSYCRCSLYYLDYVVLPVFLGGGVRTLMVAAGLAGIYTFLYITLRQQNYALLMGAIALFIVLAVVMYVTRKVAR